MDIQLKKGLLDNLVLAILLKEDSYGYKIVKDASNYIEISESTLYPILKRLEKNDLVSSYKKEHNGRLRKYFKIKEEGKSYVKEFLNDWQEVEKIHSFIEEVIDND